MKKIITIITLLLLFSNVFAISSFEAINFVKNENHFLLEGETLEQPYNPIKISEKQYWVIPITSNELIVTFFVIEHNEKKLSENKIDSRKAISTAFFLRELIKLRERFSNSPNNEWIISSKKVTEFNSLKQTISNEVFELNLIKTEMNSNEINSKIIKVQNKLESMNTQTTIVSQAIESATQKETEFISNPSEELKEKLIKDYETVFKELEKLMNLLTEYISTVNELKQTISTSNYENAAINIKRADSPKEFLNISKNYSDAESLNSNIETINSNNSLKVDSFLKINELRKKRNKAFNVLYEEDLTINKKTNQNLEKNYSIKEFVELVLNTEKYPWKNQSRIQKISTSWKQAEKYFKQEKYELAEQNALKARNDAIKTFNEGLIEEEKENLLNLKNTSILVGVLIILLIIIYVFNNREKFFKKIEEEENEVY